jgi:hypothetical protein
VLLDLSNSLLCGLCYLDGGKGMGYGVNFFLVTWVLVYDEIYSELPDLLPIVFYIGVKNIFNE